LNAFGNKGKVILQRAPLIVWETGQDEPFNRHGGCLTQVAGMPDSYLQPGKITGSKVAHEGPDTSMPARTAAGHNFYPAGSQVKVIMDYENIGGSDVKIPGKKSDAFAGAVHEILRF
jgi:hypothetical protein